MEVGWDKTKMMEESIFLDTVDDGRGCDRLALPIRNVLTGHMPRTRIAPATKFES